MQQQAARHVVANAFWYLPDGEFLTCQPLYEGESVDSPSVRVRAMRSMEVLRPSAVHLWGQASPRVYPNDSAQAKPNHPDRKPS